MITGVVVLTTSCSLFISEEPSLKVGVYEDRGEIISTVDFWADPNPPDSVYWTLVDSEGQVIQGVDAPRKEGLWLHRVLVVMGFHVELEFTARTKYAEKTIKWSEDDP